MAINRRGHAVPSLSRRALLGAGLGAGSLLALNACSGSPTGSPSGSSSGSGAAATVSHWDWFVSQEPWVKAEIEKFQEANPGLTIERTLTQADQYPEVVALSYRSDDLPDVLMAPDRPALNEQVLNGWLQPLNDLVDEEWLRRFPAYSFVEGRNVFDGLIYSAPFTGAGPDLQLYLNNQVFRDAGLADGDGKAVLPTTWDEATGFARTITESGGGSVFGFGAGNTEGIVLYQWTSVFLQAAGTPTGIDLRKAAYTYGSDRNWTDFLELMKAWLDEGLFHPDTLSMTDEVARARFAAGEIGMIVGGSWNIGGWRDNDGFEDYTCTTLIGPTPSPQLYFRKEPGGKSLGLSVNASDPEAAFTWFDWWTSPAAGASWVQDFTLGLSVYPENNDPQKITFAPFADFVALTDRSKFWPVPAIRNPDAALVANPSVTPSLSDVLTGYLTNQIDGIGSALTDLESRSNEALDVAIEDAVAAGGEVDRTDWEFSDWDPTTDYAYPDLPEYPTL